LPVELLIEVVEHLRPPRVTIGDNAAWNQPSLLKNWWERPLIVEEPKEPKEVDGPDESVLLPSQAPIYNSALLSPRVNRNFEQLCRSALYHDLNLVSDNVTNDPIIVEVVTRYQRYIRTVRITAEYSEQNKEVFDLVSSLLIDGVASLGVYYQNTTKEWIEFNNTMIRALESGRVSSFGVYSTVCFSEYLQYAAPSGATALLQSVTDANILEQFNCVDIVIERLEEAVYDRIRSQIGNISSFTVRGPFRRWLGQIWDINQYNKWYPGQSLTNLQLIHCPNAYAPHIPPVLLFFPSLKTLFVAGCGYTGDIIPDQRTAGWSFKDDAVWGKRAPLETIRVECVASWEIIALGAIHTRNLIIAAITEGGSLSESFRDEEIFPQLQTLQTELKYKELPP
ncbi:hypothetical protein M408DRAFT_46560, partial [Serendipita vermifera MAFF 305830]